MGAREDDDYWNDKYSGEWEDEEFGYVPDEENDENTVLDEELKDETLEPDRG
jgi:hypothetical protein